jgi:hypothetical protein
MPRLVHFLSYNNAVPLTISFLLLGSGMAFAASPDVRDAVYNTTSEVVAVDNTYLVNTNLDTFSPVVQISAVTEDDTHYYVSYTLNTIDVVDGTWRDTAKTRTMNVDKAFLGDTLDLGLYVTRQLAEVVNFEIAYLREAQAIEKKQVSTKVIATAYGGLVGQMLDTRTEVLPGYIPVVTPPPETVTGTGSESQVASAAGAIPPVTDPLAPTINTASESGDMVAPTLTVMGNNPARIQKGSSYVDLGVVVTDNVQPNITVHYFLDDREVSFINIDTSIAGTYTIRYEATDPSGNTGRAQRVVEVFDPSVPVVPVDAPVSTSTPTQTSATSTE